jgi:hypothetical protein
MPKQNNGLSYLDAMRLPRHERRRLAKVNGVGKILGTNKPVVKNENGTQDKSGQK